MSIRSLIDPDLEVLNFTTNEEPKVPKITHKGPQYNFQDPEYVDLVEKGIKKLEYINPDGRAIDNIRSQTDFWFYDTLKENIDKSPEQLKKAIESQETILRQAGAPIKGTEGHHPYALSGSRRLRFLPVKEQLQVGAIVSSKGYRTGTNPYGLAYLSKPAHLNIAHIDPWKIIDNERYGIPDSNNVTNFKLWSQDHPGWRLGDRLNIPFDPDTPLEEIVDRYWSETLAPQKYFRDISLRYGPDVEVRNALKRLTGVDNWKQQDLKLRASTAKLYDYFGLNFNNLVQDVERGAKLLIPNLKENVRLLKPRKTESRRFNFPETGYTKYGAGLGDFGSDFIIRNAAGEFLGIALDYKVHELILKGDYEGARDEGIAGAIIGGATQEIIRRAPMAAAVAPKLALIAAPIVLHQLADVYLKHYTGKGVAEWSAPPEGYGTRPGYKGMPTKIKNGRPLSYIQSIVGVE